MVKTIGLSIFRDWSPRALKHYMIGALIMGMILILVHMFDSTYKISYRYSRTMPGQPSISYDQTLPRDAQGRPDVRFSGNER